MEKIFYGRYRRVYIAVYLMLLVFWLGFIFSNSLANATESTQQSNKVVKIIQDIAKALSPEATVEPESIRKSAHFIEFFVLGALYYIGSFFIKASRVSLFFHSLFISILSALTDETLQIFSQGRSSEVTDVWIDFLGVLLAHIIIFAVYYSYRFFKAKQY